VTDCSDGLLTKVRTRRKCSNNNLAWWPCYTLQVYKFFSFPGIKPNTSGHNIVSYHEGNPPSGLNSLKPIQHPSVSCDLTECPQRGQAQSFDHAHMEGYVKWQPMQWDDVAFHPPRSNPYLGFYHTRKHPTLPVLNVAERRRSHRRARLVWVLIYPLANFRSRVRHGIHR